MSNMNEYYDALDSVSEHYNADIYLYSGDIGNRGYGKLVKCLASGSERQNCFLILVTSGGLANSAYQIARILQKIYDKLIVFTPSYCKSAGTLIALGAHVLVMDEFSELGPLDVQLVRTDELTGRRSGLVTKSAFESLGEQSFELFELFMLRLVVQSRGTVSFKTAAELSAGVASNLMSEVYKQVSPEIVGNDYRDLTVAVEYGNRLAAVSENPLADTVRALVHDYPSHDFIIDENEASRLFDVVDRPINEVYDLIGFIGHPIYQEADPTIVQRLRRPKPKSGSDGGPSADPPLDLEDGMERETDHERAGNGGAETAVDEGGKRDRGSDPDPTEGARDGTGPDRDNGIQ